MAGRISNLAKPGELLDKRTRRPSEPMGGKQPRDRNDGHLRLLRTMPCLSCGMLGCTEAAHISMSSAALGKRGRGIGMKSDDRWTVPLCNWCHDRQHKIGEQSFWEAIGINPILVANALWAVSPDLDQMRKVITKFRAEATR